MKKQNIFETDIWTGKIEVDNEKIKNYAYSLRSSDWCD